MTPADKVFGADGILSDHDLPIDDQRIREIAAGGWIHDKNDPMLSQLGTSTIDHVDLGKRAAVAAARHQIRILEFRLLCTGQSDREKNGAVLCGHLTAAPVRITERAVRNS